VLALKRSVPLLLAFASAAALACAQEKLVGGPYAVNVGPKTATVVWLVEDGQASLGTSPDKNERTAPAIRVRKVSYTGLQPGTTYHYDADKRDDTKGSFSTPPSGAANFEFLVFGDTRSRHDVHRRVIQAILKQTSPAFILHTGDLVADGADSAQWPIFFDIERDLLRKAAFFPVLGNHEHNNRQYYDFFDVSTPYYSFNWGSCHFSVLDSDVGNVSTSAAAREAFWAEQVRWLEDDLKKNQSADFRFVVAHHPPMSAVPKRQDSNPQMTALIPMFEKWKVNAGFFGHDHTYQHYLKNGIHYYVTGGGGAPLYAVSNPPEGITVKVASTENFVVIKVNGKTARVEAKQLDGQLLDTTELTR
jgi:predicted phosphodiesterase